MGRTTLVLSSSKLMEDYIISFVFQTHVENAEPFVNNKLTVWAPNATE